MTQDTSSRRLLRWLSANRWVWWLPFLAASAVFSGWASFTSQRFLGELIGWDSPWLMPAILDNLVVGTVLAFILMPGWTTWVTAVAVLLVSSVANAQAHYYDPATADLAVPMWVAVGWSVLPPVAFFTIAHFVVAARRDRTNGTVAPASPARDAGLLVRLLRRLHRPRPDAGVSVAGSPPGPPPAAAPTRAPAKRRTRTPAGKRHPNSGLSVEDAAAEARRLRLTSSQQVKDELHVGSKTAYAEPVVAAVTANRDSLNGH